MIYAIFHDLLLLQDTIIIFSILLLLVISLLLLCLFSGFLGVLSDAPPGHQVTKKGALATPRLRLVLPEASSSLQILDVHFIFPFELFQVLSLVAHGRQVIDQLVGRFAPHAGLGSVKDRLFLLFVLCHNFYFIIVVRMRL